MTKRWLASVCRGAVVVAVGFSSIALAQTAAQTVAQTAPARRPLTVADAALLRTVSDPQVSPDGKWIAYTVGAVDMEKDRRDSDVWMATWDGADRVRLTSLPDSSESRPRLARKAR